MWKPPPEVLRPIAIGAIGSALSQSRGSSQFDRRPTPGPDTRKRLLMDTPEEGWEAYYADKKVSESDKKKPAQGAGSSHLISEKAPVSRAAR